MDIKDYEFKIGDKVITTEGEVGKIIGICKCEKCAERGFFEPIWETPESEYDIYIDKYQAEAGFPSFYKIGKYRFHDFDKDEVLQNIAYHEKELNKLKKQLSLIEEVEEGYVHI